MIDAHIPVRILLLAIAFALLWLGVHQIKSGWAPTRSGMMPAGWINRQTSQVYFWWSVIGTFVGAFIFFFSAFYKKQ